MSRLVVPVKGQVLWATGDVRLWAQLDLSLKTASGGWLSKTFRVDSGTEITTLSARAAKQWGLALPQTPVQGANHYPTGLEMRSGYLRFRIDGMDPTEYAVPCLFLGDPDRPPLGPAAVFPRRLLQPLALLDHLRFDFDKTPSPAAVHGQMTVEKT